MSTNEIHDNWPEWDISKACRKVENGLPNS